MKAGVEVRYISGTKIPYMGMKSGKRVALAGKEARLEGLETAMSELNLGVTKGIASMVNDVKKVTEAVQYAALKGLSEASAFINEDMNKTPPMIPVDTGALRQGYKIKPKVIGYKSGDKLIAVESGWMDTSVNRIDPETGKMETVDQYAAYVHEMTTPPYGKVNWNIPGSGPKFLEAAVKRNAQNITKIVQNEISKILI